MLVPMTLRIDSDKRGSQRGSLSTRASAAEDVQPCCNLFLKQKDNQQWDNQQLLTGLDPAKRPETGQRHSSQLCFFWGLLSAAKGKIGAVADEPLLLRRTLTRQATPINT
jgi:hypothetical protein